MRTNDKTELRVKLERIKLLVLDFDGVLTDNHVFVDETGHEFVSCSRSDGFGIEKLNRLTDIGVVVLSKEKNNVVRARCEKLHIECFNGLETKIETLKMLSVKKEIPFENIAYIGNDENDVECMMAVGLGIAVHDAHISALNVADFILSKNGGCGAVREFIDMILNIKEMDFGGKENI